MKTAEVTNTEKRTHCEVWEEDIMPVIEGSTIRIGGSGRWDLRWKNRIVVASGHLPKDAPLSVIARQAKLAETWGRSAQLGGGTEIHISKVGLTEEDVQKIYEWKKSEDEKMNQIRLDPFLPKLWEANGWEVKISPSDNFTMWAKKDGKTLFVKKIWAGFSIRESFGEEIEITTEQISEL